MKNPLISILIPMYNAAEYIERAVLSATRQTYENIEILIVDNCSTDNSVEIVKGISDTRIKLYQNEANLGFSGNINRGIDLCNGEYIKFLCADDELRENAVEKLYEFAQATESDVLYCNGYFIDENNRLIYDRGSYKRDLLLDYTHANCKKILTGKYNISCCVSYLFLKNDRALNDRVYFIKIDGSDYNSDLVFLFDNFKKFQRLSYVNRNLVLLRRHVGQGTYHVNGTDIFFKPLKFHQCIIKNHNLKIKGTARFRYRFYIFKNGCNAYLKSQRKIPKAVYKQTVKEFGFGYYLILALYVPFVYAPKKLINKARSRRLNRRKKNENI